MIRIDRPATEPTKLASARATALAALRPAGPATRKDLPGTYKVAHDDLWRAQHSKCAYCEAREQSKRNDVEHFRPAMRADREPGSTATHGYWWLAYTWDPDRRRMRGALGTGDAATIEGAWKEFVSRHVVVSSVFAGLARDVLAADVPEAAQHQYALVLPAL